MRYHGGKWRLARWIMAHFPAHHIYVEPFGGVASVLIRKQRSPIEVYNDLDEEMVNVMRVLQDAALCERLVYTLSLTPYARMEFQQAWATTDHPVERARRTFIRAEMGFGSAGATKGMTGFRMSIRCTFSSATHVWRHLPQGLPPLAGRLQGVLLENQPALKTLHDHDTPQTLFYVDPPYLPATRQKGKYYRHEMSHAEHIELLDTLRALKGWIALSGYSHPVYENTLKGWRRVETPARISGNRGSNARTEVLWLSPNVPEGSYLR
jgi:DNA adenine methylase